MSRLRRRPEDHSALTAAIDTLIRDGAAPATVEPLSDLSLAEARILRARWAGMPHSVRLAIVKHMAALGEGDLRFDFERALTVAMSDDDPEIRLAATGALWESESTGLLTELLNLLARETNSRVRLAAVDALGRFARLGGEGRLEEAQRETTEQTLMGIAMDDPDEALRLEAMAAAAYLRPESIEPRIERAYDEGHDEAREVALRAMGRFGGHQWASRVIDSLRAGDSDQRIEATRAAPYVEERRVIPYLYEAAEDDESQELQLAALEALGEIGGREIRSFLEAVRDSTEGETSQAAEEALANAALLDGSVSDAIG